MKYKIYYLKAKPTESGYYCNQDNDFNNITFSNVCKQVIAINFQYQCATEYGELKCSEGETQWILILNTFILFTGKFLVAESRAEPYEAIFTIRDLIRLPSLGLYEFIFYTLFNSPNAEVGDSLSIEIKYDKASAFESIYSNSSSNNRIRETKWTKERLQFRPLQKSFQVI